MTIFYEPKPPIIDAIPESGHCVIEASAGTGKTFTIQKIFLDLLLKGMHPKDFLIVTFTRKATAELRERLHKAITETLAHIKENKNIKKPDETYWEINENQCQFLESSLDNFHRAQISTLDSLTQRILRENLDIALVQSDAKVQASVPMIQAFEYFTRVVVPQDEWLLAMMAAYDNYIYDTLDNLDVPPKNNYDIEKENLYRDLTEFTKQQTEKITGVKFPPGIHHPNAFFRQYIAWFETARQHLQSENWKTYWAQCMAGFEHVREAGKTKLLKSVTDTLKLFCDSMQNAKPHDWLKIATIWTKLPDLKDECIQKYLAAMDNPLLEAVFSMRIYGFSKKYFVAAYALPKYRDCMQKFHIEQAAYKFDTYTDMLCETLRSHEGEELAARLRKRWKLVIVDEFQDTSPAQWEILERCFLHHAHESRLFLIGDPKQAIYAFRGGDIYTYKKAVQDIREIYGSDHILALTSNYRSTPAILDAINRFYYRESEDTDDALFSCVNPEDPERYAYRNIYAHEIDAGHKDWQCLHADGSPCEAVSLIPIDDSKGKPKDWNESLADKIADEIQCYFGNNCPMLKKGSEVKPLKKIFVLARNHKDFEPLAKRLVLAGIPFVPSETSDTNRYSQPEILELTSLMLAILEPMKSGHLEAALHTTFFGLNTRDVAYHMASEKSALKTHFKRWAEMAQYPQKFHLIFEEILDVTQYASRLALFSYTQDPYENVCRVMDELCARALYDDLSWAGLLDWMHQMRQGKISADPVKTMEPQATVNFLTIHKCKGLEADAVFLLCPREISAKSKEMKETEPKFYHIFENGRWNRVLRPPKSSLQTLKTAYFELSQEHERLLYVALTRAAVRLYLPRYLSFQPNAPLCVEANGVEISDVYRRLQHVLCKTYGQDIPKNMLPLCMAWQRESGKPAMTLQEAWHQLKKLISTQDIETPNPLQKRHYRAQQTASYSSLKHKTKAYHGGNIELVPSAWHEAIKPTPEMRWPELPKGRNTGLFLHAVFERIRYDAVYRLRHHSAENWLQDENSEDVREIKSVFEKCAREYQFPEKAVIAAQQLVFLTLTTPQPKFAPKGLCGTDGHRAEVDFLVRYHDLMTSDDDADHALHAFFENAIGNADFAVRNGDFLTGSIDCCYRVGHTWYILDWKSDCLDSYAPEALKAYVDQHYDYQVAIYRHAFKRIMHTMLSENSQDKFGGMVYVFIRGILPGKNDGFVFLPETEE